MQFEYPEDREFFANLLTEGDEKRLEVEFADCFDFRHPAIKRWEFNKIRKKLLAELVLKYGKNCQLRIHSECSKDEKYEPDHVIPLSTNELNKNLRHMVRTSSGKVPAQSFGSNSLRNLTLSCKRCNAFKKHHLIVCHNLAQNADDDPAVPPSSTIVSNCGGMMLKLKQVSSSHDG